MKNKQFKGKAIYNPSGKAGEYSYWACNFYNGCSNGCEYCYCKKGILAKTMGGDVPTLKKCFKDETHALEVFVRELEHNKEELQNYGLFFSFTTDPMLKEISNLTWKAIMECLPNIPVKILTKRADFKVPVWVDMQGYREKIAFGFTLTGHDELEPGASTNQERIETMKKLHDAGFKTFASIEPIIDFENSLDMIEESIGYCDLYKIGLMSGKKYPINETKRFVELVSAIAQSNGFKIYFKDSLLDQAGIKREDLPSICVERDYNLFK